MWKGKSLLSLGATSWCHPFTLCTSRRSNAVRTRGGACEPSKVDPGTTTSNQHWWLHFKWHIRQPVAKTQVKLCTSRGSRVANNLGSLRPASRASRPSEAFSSGTSAGTRTSGYIAERSRCWNLLRARMGWQAQNDTHSMILLSCAKTDHWLWCVVSVFGPCALFFLCFSKCLVLFFMTGVNKFRQHFELT